MSKIKHQEKYRLEAVGSIKSENLIVLQFVEPEIIETLANVETFFLDYTEKRFEEVKKLQNQILTIEITYDSEALEDISWAILDGEKPLVLDGKKMIFD